MFTKDRNKMILASAVPSSSSSSSEQDQASFPHSLQSIGMLDDITFWVLDVVTGHVLGSKTFKNDYIFLTNHSGVHLYNDYLAVASVQNQSIYLCLIRVGIFDFLLCRHL